MGVVDSVVCEERIQTTLRTGKCSRDRQADRAQPGRANRDHKRLDRLDPARQVEYSSRDQIGSRQSVHVAIILRLRFDSEPPRARDSISIARVVSAVRIDDDLVDPGDRPNDRLCLDYKLSACRDMPRQHR